MSRAISALAPADLHLEQYLKVPKVGYNPGHEGILGELYTVSNAITQSFREASSHGVKLQVSKKLQVWGDVARQVSPSKFTLKQRMKADREGILKRLRTGMRKKVKLESALGQPKRIVPVISVEPVKSSMDDLKKPYTWIE